MSIDTRGRTAAEGLRAASRPVDTGTMLRAMHARRSQRNRRVAIAATLAVALAVGVVSATVRQSQAPAGPGQLPTPRDSCAAPFQSVPPIAKGQSLGGVTCLGGHTYRRDLQVPFTFTLPPTLTVWIEQGTSNSLFYASRLRNGVRDQDTGVLVMERAVAVRPTLAGQLGAGGHTVADPTAGTSARSVARWLSERPFVSDVAVTVTTLAGRQAYEVDLARGGTPTGGYGLVFADGTGPLSQWFGVGPGTRVRCWLLDLPGARLAVVWSQSNRGLADLEANQPLVDSLMFAG